MYKNLNTLELLDETVCSNFDKIIDYKIVEKLKNNSNVRADYPCSDCHCRVWYDQEKQQFGCQIWVYGSIREDVYKDTMEEIKDYVCNEYSYD